MSLANLGITHAIEAYRTDEGLSSFDLGRVISEHKDRYVVQGEDGDYDAELIGNLRFTAESRRDLPCVGDWVAFSEYDEGKALIHAIYPRYSVLERKAVGQGGKIQIIASNVDYGIIIQSVDRDFNLNRLERYLTICYTAGIEPIVVLSKSDLISPNELSKLHLDIEKRLPDVSVIDVSNQEEGGYDEIRKQIQVGKTYCLLGSSGVGKSTLLNHLQGRDLMETGEISSSVNKGKHTTTHRELVVLETGGVMIDNPGMRELGITDGSHGLEMTFQTLAQFAENCKYSDCKHINEKGCAVLEALDSGELDEDAYNNYLKLEREKNHFESTVQERRKKDKKFGKMYKSVKKHRRDTKF
jgi:ribosome biogenesis GTPase